MKGSNGLSVRENLEHRLSKPVYDKKAEVPMTKCPAHPTKRLWEDPNEAAREAVVRSQITQGIAIVAYRCDGCQNYHLCKAENARPGSVVVERRVERNWEVFTAKPANPEAIRKMLGQYLEGRTEVTSAEVCEALGLTQSTVAKYMLERRWFNSKGRHAKWRPEVTTVIEEPVEEPQAKVTPLPMVTPLQVIKARQFADEEASRSRHPASLDAGWMPLADFERLRHIPLGDIIDTLAVAGIQIRVQQRSIR